jgi:hypothetical protein
MGGMMCYVDFITTYSASQMAFLYYSTACSDPRLLYTE